MEHGPFGSVYPCSIGKISVSQTVHYQRVVVSSCFIPCFKGISDRGVELPFNSHHATLPTGISRADARGWVMKVGKLDWIVILVGGGLEHCYFSIYWESSSQLTNIFQRGWNHQPVLLYVNRIEQTQQTRAQGIKIFSQLAAMQQIAVLPWKFLTSCRKLVPSLHSTWSGLNA